jgi:CBS domain-containing protein
MRMGHARATEVAATLGQVLAIIMALVGLFVSPVLLFIALFVWLGATHEAAATRVRAALSNTQARAVMLTDFATLESGDTLAEAVRLTLSGSQRDFPVIDGGVVTGVLSRSDLLTALTRHGMDQPVTLAMRSEVSIAQASEMLDTVFARLQEKGAGAIPVVSGGLLVGLVTVDNVQEYLLIHATLEEYKLRTSGAAERPVKRNSAANS